MELDSSGDDLFAEPGQVVLVGAAWFADQPVQAQSLEQS